MFVQEFAIFVPKLLKKSLKRGGEVVKSSYKVATLATLWRISKYSLFFVFIKGLVDLVRWHFLSYFSSIIYFEDLIWI